MPKVLILCAHRPNRSPSQRYRFEQYLPYLEAQGFSFTFSYLLNKKDDQTFYAKGRFFVKVVILIKSVFIRIKDALRYRKFDIVFIQREALFLGTSFFENRAGKSTASFIFDFDDSIWLADTSPGNQKWEFIKKPGKFFETVSYADRVIAGNFYLAEQARPLNTHTVIIPTTINTEVHVPKLTLRNKDVITIGWSGSISTVKHFELILPVLLKLKDRYQEKIQFVILGDKNYTCVLPGLQAYAWTEETEVDVLNSFDIGIMPLPDDAWAKGKCGLKGLSYMACEVPAVLSAVGVNREIIDHGKNGFLATTDAEWMEYLCLLIESKELREKTGKAGRLTVLEKYSVESNKQKYLELFSNAGKL